MQQATDSAAGSYTPVPKHTPGPWKWDGHMLVPETRDPDQHAVHTIIGRYHSAHGFIGSELNAVIQEDDANRALIAAAPELFKAAKLVYDEMSAVGELSPLTFELLAAALDKATGAA